MSYRPGFKYESKCQDYIHLHRDLLQIIIIYLRSVITNSYYIKGTSSYFSFYYID